MVHRIEIGLKNEPALAKKARELLGLEVSEAFSLSVYSLDFDVSYEQLRFLADNAFSDKIIERGSVDAPWVGENNFDFDVIVEKRFKPGVTDAVGKTARQVAEAVLQRKLNDDERVYSAVQYIFRGKLSEQDAGTIASQLLGNPLIEQFFVLTKGQFKANQRIPRTVPKVVDEHVPRVDEMEISKFDDQQLTILNQSRQMALNLEELKAIKAHYRDSKFLEARKRVGMGAKATDVELEVLAQTWSEHCKHKEFNAIIDYVDFEGGGKKQVIDGLFPAYIAGATKKILPQCPWLVSIFQDNAGVVKFNDDYYFALKVETHNSPSALDPYGGALTGIVGNNRDIAGVGMGGADLWFNQFYYCLADPHYDGELPPKTMSPRLIFEGIVAGVRDGGNKCGVPTVNGGLSFDKRFMGKPLVYCGTGGLMKAKIAGKDSSVKKALPGDLAIVVGGRIGKDGIHGATMSSEERSETTPVAAVQIGDPIVQKLMLDFLQVARDKGLIRGITDNGAGGLSSSFGEMARLSGGVRLELSKAPLKYHGLQPWEILVSEAQERMSVAIPVSESKEFLGLAKERGVEATVLGEFTDSGFFEVYYDGKPVVYLGLEFLHHGVPRKKLQAEWRVPKYPEREVPFQSIRDSTLSVLSALDVCIKEWVFRQKDNNVKGGTLMPPVGGVKGQVNIPAALIKPVGLDGTEAVAASQAAYPKYGDGDPKSAALCAFAEAAGKIIALGGQLPDEQTFWCACDNFCVPDSVYSERNPDGKYKLGQLIRLCQGAYEFATTLGIPFTSGKDSMKNDLKYEKGGKTYKISVPPTLLITLVAKINDFRRTLSIDFKQPGDFVYVVGKTKGDMGGSQYFEQMGFRFGSAPLFDPAESKRLFAAVSIALRHASSAYYVGKGGLAVAVAECALAGGLGAKVSLKAVPAFGVKRSDFLYTSETPNRFLITVAPGKAAEFEAALQDAAFSRVGEVTADKTVEVQTLEGRTERMFLQELSDAYSVPLREDLPEVRV